MRNNNARIDSQRTKTLEQQIAEDKYSKRIQYGEISEHAFKNGNLSVQPGLKIKTAQGSYLIVIPKNELALVEEKLSPFWKDTGK